MVNVAGRSKGCTTCRRRKVKCDETRPVCNRCARCGFDCDGAKDMAFIEGTIVKSRRSVKRVSTSTTARSEILNPLKERLPMKNFEFEIFVCYARRHLSRGRAIDLALEKHSLSTIIEAGLSIDSSGDQVFPQALLSFAVIVFGADHSQKTIADKGYLFLGSTFQRLNQALLDPNCYARDEVILAVATIAILECLVPTGAENYLKHMLGLEKLLELRDPSKFSSRESIDLYKSIRHMLLFSTLRTGRPSILAKPEWKAVLRQYCSEDELQEQDLLDVLADCTVINSEAKTIFSESNPDDPHVKEKWGGIEQRALALLASLHEWKNIRGIVGVIDIHGSLNDLGSDVNGMYEFTNEAAALLHMLYNTTLICVLSTVVYLPQPSQISDRKSQQSARRRAAVEICRCVPYYVKAQNSKEHPHGSPTAHWAIATAWRILSENISPEEARMVELLSMKGKGITAKAIWQD